MTANAIRALKALGPIDARSVHRDELLRWLLLLPLLIALLLRFGLPYVTAQVLVRFGFDLGPYHTLLMSFVVMAMPLLVGMVIGFLLLDERDDRTLTALQVTPLTLNGYLAYRLALPIVLSVLVTVLMVPLSGVRELAPGQVVVVALSAAPLAPLFALFLATFAANKVQGFALGKLSSVLYVPAVAAYFVPAWWQPVFGLSPAYWPAKLYWALEAGDPGAGVHLLAGLAYQGLALWLLVRRFNRVMYR